MTWKKVNPMDERLKFVIEVSLGAENISTLCRKYEISRKTGYKWLKRYWKHGLYGMKELSKAPHYCPHKTPIEMREALVALRKANPRIGPKKIAGELRSLGLSPPAPSTIAAILKQEGMTRSRKKRNTKFRQCPERLTIPDHPNHVWTVDYKGWFRIHNGEPCYPLTVMDLFSRFLIGCDALRRPAFEPTWTSFDKLFSRFGLPRVIRVDNGTPFAGHGAGGLSQLNILWLRLGIDVEFI
ncbi:DDE-type integrase/transposase/recombinase, partial [Pseudodesulfovibrio sp. JC047]|uniref:helix-turn-helix domain-containing protein n=1 Tax=Pseudodesulfovibrio sp. JC047 TaxID=2683199 RepID=UPI0013D3E519